MIDHLVYATTDLETSVRELAERLGVTAAPGGHHVGRGTRNFLLSLGGNAYLELIGPDPDQSDFTGVRSMGLDTLGPPQLVAWATRVMDIEEAIALARERGYDPGPARSMSRRQPDGGLLSWQLTDVPGDTVPVLLPFLIDWKDSPHPSTTAPGGARLDSFHIETPEREKVREALASLNVDVPIEVGDRPQLIATIKGPAGDVTLQ